MAPGFLDTPRHVFVPGHPLAEAYAQDVIVTQWRAADDLGSKRPTSSLSAPAAVVVMLERLDVHQGHRVLEIGTGTGYNAALLCHRLGAANVCSIDIDSELVDSARLALAAAGHHPPSLPATGMGVCPSTRLMTVSSPRTRAPPPPTPAACTTPAALSSCSVNSTCPACAGPTTRTRTTRRGAGPPG